MGSALVFFLSYLYVSCEPFATPFYLTLRILIFKWRCGLILDCLTGTICDDYFGLEDASVVCQMLGFEMASYLLNSSDVLASNATIWMDDVTCTGNENSIDTCRFAGWGNSDCSSDENVGIVCTNDVGNTTGSEGDVRLVPGPTEGRIDIYHNGTWGKQLHDIFDSRLTL